MKQSFEEGASVTLLTIGLVDALLTSRLKGHQRIETPELLSTPCSSLAQVMVEQLAQAPYQPFSAFS